MARIGRFGRLPADAPDLTSAIVSLYEQFERQRDENILNAWREGGLFEDKPVTDQRILDWYRMRREQVSREDPMWDYWNDAYHQTRFAIAEQKANLRYTQKKWTEGDMAQFYRQWAGKVPRASAAWRDLMTSAARFAQAAKAGRASSSSAARVEAMNARLSAIDKNMIQPAYDLLNALNWAGQRGFEDGTAASFSLGSTTDPNSNTIYNFNINLDSASSLDEQLAYIQSNPAQRKRMTQAIRQYVPGFDGNLTVGVLIEAIGRAKQGYRNQARVLRGYGERDAARERLAEGRKFNNELATLRSIDLDLPEQYLLLRSEFDEDMAAANGPIGRQMVREQQAADLELLARRYEQQGALTQAGALRARAAAMRGDESAAAVASLDEAYTGRSASDTSGRAMGDNSENGRLVQAALQDQQQLDLLSKGGVIIRTVDPRTGETQEQVVPAGAESVALGVQGGSRVARRSIAYGGGIFRFASGDITIPQGTITEAAVEQPVVISIPNPSDPADLVQTGLISGAGLPTVAGRTKVVGSRTDWGNGQVVWGSPVGPGGHLLYSDVPPFNGTGVSRQGLQDGVWQVQYDIAAIDQMNADGGLGAILSQIVDPTTGEPVTNADGSPKVQFDPRTLVGGSPYVVPQLPDPLDPDQQQAAKDAGLYEFSAQPNFRDAVLARPDGVPDPLWQQMLDEVQGGADIDSPEFQQKWIDRFQQEGLGKDEKAGTRIAANSIFTSVRQTIRRYVDNGALTNGLATKPGAAVLRNTPPPQVPADVWARMVDDRAAGMSTPDLIAKYQADFDKAFPGNPAAAQGILTRAVSESTKVDAPAGTQVEVLKTPTVTSAQDLVDRGRAFDQAFYATLAVHPASVSWFNQTLTNAGRSPESRSKWAATVDPEEYVREEMKRDPSLKDPAFLAVLVQQVDVMTGAGRSGIAEGEFATERMIAAGVNPNIASGATVRGQYTSRNRTSVADIFGLGRTGLEPTVPAVAKPTGAIPRITPQGFVLDQPSTTPTTLPDRSVAGPASPQAESVGITSEAQPIRVPQTTSSGQDVGQLLAARRQNVVRPSGVKPFAQPKPVKPPKIKEPKIIVPQVPNVPVPIGSGGQQTQRRPGGVILS